MEAHTACMTMCLACCSYDWKVDAVVLQLIPDQSEGNEVRKVLTLTLWASLMHH